MGRPLRHTGAGNSVLRHAHAEPAPDKGPFVVGRLHGDSRIRKSRAFYHDKILGAALTRAILHSFAQSHGLSWSQYVSFPHSIALLLCKAQMLTRRIRVTKGFNMAWVCTSKTSRAIRSTSCSSPISSYSTLPSSSMPFPCTLPRRPFYASTGACSACRRV